MLLNLHVKNLALIDETEVAFGPGLNILTGETGAGKSIIIGSINLALGEKAQKSMLRSNAEYALIELVFSTESVAQLAALKELGVEPEDGQIIMSRKIYASGRSVCRINSETVTAALMRKTASVLIDIHGQHEHQTLLSKKNHMKYLDAYASQELDPLLGQLSEVYHRYTGAKKALEEASLDTEQQARELSFLQFEISEIEEAGLQPGEDEALETEYRRLSHARKILDALGESREYCSDGNESASDQIGRSLRSLLSVSEYDGEVSALADQLQEIDSLLSDFNRELEHYLDGFEFSDQMFEDVEKRLDVINQLKTKYGRTIELILQEKEEKEQRALRLQHYDEYRQELAKALAASERELQRVSKQVTAIRKKYAKELVSGIQDSLRALNFRDVQFRMDFTNAGHYTANGTDEARFMISTNPGEAVRPLDEIASGGELSRIMLAIKTVLAEHDEIETLIFDEIDSGISGRTAQMVAEKIRQTGRSHQIICITHLPQIAAMADRHYLIEKTSSNDTTISQIRLLDREESIQELGRMLGGVSITKTVLLNAREMKEMAEQVT